MRFIKHEIWRRTMFDAFEAQILIRGVVGPSASTILVADNTSWTMIAQNCRTGIVPIGLGRPLEEALPEVLKDEPINRMLSPRQGTQPAKQHAHSTQAVSELSGSKLEKQNAELRKQLETQQRKYNADIGTGKGRSQPRLWGTPRAGKGQKGNGNKGNSKKGKGKKDKHSMPQGFEAGERERNGSSFCFGYNLGNCIHAKNGQSCAKAGKQLLHKCCVKGCDPRHPYHFHH